jgi:hypothetical protein
MTRDGPSDQVGQMVRVLGARAQEPCSGAGVSGVVVCCNSLLVRRKAAVVLMSGKGCPFHGLDLPSVM